MNLDFVLAILVLVLALAALAYPLYRARTQIAGVDVSTLDDLLAQRDGVYATLRDLELDQELGKLDVNDYTSLRERYMLRATEILQQLDVLRGEGGGKEASTEIEREVAALRHMPAQTPDTPIKDEQDAINTKRLTTDNERPTTKDKQRTTSSSEMFCTNCGRPYKKGDKFCARCGKALG